MKRQTKLQSTAENQKPKFEPGTPQFEMDRYAQGMADLIERRFVGSRLVLWYATTQEILSGYYKENGFIKDSAAGSFLSWFAYGVFPYYLDAKTAAIKRQMLVDACADLCNWVECKEGREAVEEIGKALLFSFVKYPYDGDIINERMGDLTCLMSLMDLLSSFVHQEARYHKSLEERKALVSDTVWNDHLKQFSNSKN